MLLDLARSHADRGDNAQAAGRCAACLRLWGETESRETLVNAAAALGDVLGFVTSRREQTQRAHVTVQGWTSPLGAPPRAMRSGTASPDWNASDGPTVLWEARLLKIDEPFTTFVDAEGTPVS